MCVCLSVCVAGVGMLMFVARAALGGGPNLVCTVLVLTIATHIALGRPLGRRLHVQLDNTTAENKNNVLLSLVALFVAWEVFDEATVFFMPVGHTFNELDSAFSPLISSMHATVIPTISAMLAAISSALATKRVRKVASLPHLWDFQSYLKKYTHHQGGFATTQQSSGMHEFNFSRDSEGQVRMHARQSSQSSTWLPEGDGDLIFKSVPDRSEAPPIAKIASDSSWLRSAVLTGIRRWLPYLGLSTHEFNKASSEWECIFAELPLDGDISKLSEAERLVWPVLQPRSDSSAVRDTTGKPLHPLRVQSVYLSELL